MGGKDQQQQLLDTTRLFVDPSRRSEANSISTPGTAAVPCRRDLGERKIKRNIRRSRLEQEERRHRIIRTARMPHSRYLGERKMKRDLREEEEKEEEPAFTPTTPHKGLKNTRQTLQAKFSANRMVIVSSCEGRIRSQPRAIRELETKKYSRGRALVEWYSPLSATQEDLDAEAVGDEEAPQRSSQSNGVDASINDRPIIVEGTLVEDASRTEVFRQKKCFVVAAVLVFILVSLVIVDRVTVVQRNHSDSASSGDRDKASNQQKIDLMVPGMADETTQAILTLPLSVQARAYEWISTDPKWKTYEDWHKQQRFALVCIIWALQPRFSFSNLHRDTHECIWITAMSRFQCNQDGQVTRATFFTSTTAGLSSFAIVHDKKGHVPPEIAFLWNLEAIEFRNSWTDETLSGILPLSTLRGLTSLKELILHNIGLTGSIPSTLGWLTCLTALDLSKNEMRSTVPSELGLLSNLNKLILSSNKFSGSIPEAIGNLSYLSKFQVSNNPSLEAPLPDGFCNNEPMPSKSLQTDWCSGTTQCCLT